MESTHKILKNYLWTLINQLLNMFFPLITYGYTARILLAENLGKIAYSQSIVSYFAVVSGFGLGIYGTRVIAKTSGYLERSKAFWSLFFLKLFTGMICFPVYLLLILRLNSLDLSLSLIMGTTIFSSVLNSDWYFQGIEEFKWLTFRNFFVRVVAMSLTLLFVKYQSDFHIFASIIVFSEFLLHFLMFVKVAKLNSEKRANLEPFKHFLRASFYLGSAMFITISAQIQKTIIGTFIAVSDVGYYLAAEKLFNTALVMITSLGPAAMARISAEESNGERSSGDIASKTFLWQSFIASALSGLLIVASRDLTILLFGSSFGKASFLLIFLAIGLIPKSIVNWVAMNVLVPKENEKAFFWLFALNAILSIAFAYIFMVFFGVLGVAISTAVTEIVVSLIVQRGFKEQNIVAKIRGSFRYYVALSISLFFTLIIDMLWDFIHSLPNLFSLLFKAVIFGLVFLFILLIAKDPIIMSSASFFRKFVSRQK